VEERYARTFFGGCYSPQTPLRASVRLALSGLALWCLTPQSPDRNRHSASRSRVAIYSVSCLLIAVQMAELRHALRWTLVMSPSLYRIDRIARCDRHYRCGSASGFGAVIAPEWLDQGVPALGCDAIPSSAANRKKRISCG
jgi:hypothetical protein